jgi:glucose-1-phosphate adenylyltransferase
MRVMAFILAGGEGSRLSVLTAKRTKPAVPFAGKYRIIDFTLSNCVNSGIYNVGILTQYRPRSLNDHIRIGRPWDLDRMNGGVQLLQPYLGRKDMDWYKGTADAVYQNLNLVHRYKVDHVLILSGDHIYKMDYGPMLRFHEEKGADLTVAAIKVKPEEVQRFGVLSVDEHNRVVGFQEKPTELQTQGPILSLASMGVYVFNSNVLGQRLEEDARRRTSHDFGKDIIPRMMELKDEIYAYPFGGYWVDVGTIQAYWEAHMDLLLDSPPFDLYDPDWVFHTRSEERPPVRVSAEAALDRRPVSNGCVIGMSLVSNGCIIRGRVEHSVLSPGVQVGPGALVRHSIVMTDTVIGERAVVDHAILDKNIVVGARSHIGFGDDCTPNEAQPDLCTGITVVGKNTIIPGGIKIGRNCFIDCDLQESDFDTDLVTSGSTVGHSLEV